MQNCSNWKSTLFEVACGATDADDVAGLKEHLEGCPACAMYLEGLRASLPLSPPERVDPGPVFWNQFETRLSERIRVESTRQGLQGRVSGWLSRRLEMPSTGLRLPRMFSAPSPGLRLSLQLAVALVLVVGGVFIGRTSFGPMSGEEMVQAPSQDGTSNVISAALQERTRAYLDRSTTLLLGLVNHDATDASAMSLNLERRQAIAGQLMSESAELQEQLSQANEQRLQELIADLEVILLQIAAIESEHDVPGIEMLQSGVDRKAILFKIQVEQIGRIDSPALPQPTTPAT